MRPEQHPPDQDNEGCLPDLIVRLMDWLGFQPEIKPLDPEGEARIDEYIKRLDAVLKNWGTSEGETGVGSTEYVLCASIVASLKPLLSVLLSTPMFQFNATTAILRKQRYEEVPAAVRATFEAEFEQLTHQLRQRTEQLPQGTLSIEIEEIRLPLTKMMARYKKLPITHPFELLEAELAAQWADKVYQVEKSIYYWFEAAGLLISSQNHGFTSPDIKILQRAAAYLRSANVGSAVLLSIIIDDLVTEVREKRKHLRS
jgi:hypothetical protein